MYNFRTYCGFIACHERTDAFVKALLQTVKPDSVVLDIGAGIGFFAVKAAMLGAIKVYAIEYNDAIEHGKELAARNGCADKIEFIKGISTDIELPEQVDIIISDLRGTLPLFSTHIPSIVDARKRFLAPHGILIGQKDYLWAGIVETVKGYDKNIANLYKSKYGVDMSMVKKNVVNDYIDAPSKKEDLLAKPQSFYEIDYYTIEDPNMSREINFTVNRNGTARGFNVWFEAIIGKGISFSNAPDNPLLPYKNPFFPFENPVEVEIGDVVSIKLSANLVEGDYIWSWDTKVYSNGQQDNIKADFKQSTFYADVFALKKLQKQHSAYVPTLIEDGEIELFILSQMNGESSLDEIAKRLTEKFPKQFPTWKKALTHVGKSAYKFS